MKSVDEIEKMGLEDLERISLDESIEVPEDLESRLVLSLGPDRTVHGIPWTERLSNRKPVRIIGVAASLAIIAGVGFAWLGRPKPLQDTFDDPMLAYAAVEEALNKVASTVEVGGRSVAMSEELLRKPGEVINSIQNK